MILCKPTNMKYLCISVGLWSRVVYVMISVPLLLCVLTFCLLSTVSVLSDYSGGGGPQYSSDGAEQGWVLQS